MYLTVSKTLQIAALAAVTSFSNSSIAQDRNIDRGQGNRDRQVQSQNQGSQDRGQGRQSRGSWGMMGAGGMNPDYLLRDLQRFQIALELEEQQTIIVEQILRDYDESFREASDASREGIGSSWQSMRGSEDDPARQLTQELREREREIRDKLESAQNLGDESGMNELRDRLNGEMESIREQMQQARADQWQSPERQAAFEEMALLLQDQLRLKKQMREEFEGDLVAILTEEQQALWPPLQRQLIRDRLLPRGRLSGETIDVMSLVEQQEFEDEVLMTLLPVLQEWDESVTPALTERDNHITENQNVLMSAMSTMDSTAGVDVLKTQGRLAETVRDINDNAIENIVLLLQEHHPIDKSIEFDAFAKERGYPRIFRPTRTDRAFEAAMELEDLEVDILQAIVDLYDSLQIEMAFANEQVLEATHRWEAQEQIDRMSRWSQRMTGGSSERPESPIQKAEEDRRTIEENYLEQLRMLLTPEQIEALGGLESRQQRRENGNRDWSNRGDREGQRGGSQEMRQQFMNRFDSDGDGRISESEREAIREHFQNGGGHDFGGGQGGGSRGGMGGGGRP